ncbi:phosphodiesterase [Rubrivivax gelatinosus]|nr:phosphodiesterase [Rubrivivax gelatinosus]
MLKKISVDDLRLGMHLHAFEGAWINHPFWRTRFVIEDGKTLAEVLASGVRECWIDTALGLDVARPETELRPPPAAPPVAPAAAKARAPRPPTTSMAEELKAAAEVCKRGREAVVSMFSDARLGRAIDGEACMPLVEQVTDSVFRNPGALVSLARLKTHDDYTYMHSVAVCALMVALGRQLGADDAECRRLGLAGLLHDIGKALMPPEVLNKPGKLTDDEFDVMRSHPERGHVLLQEARGAGDDALEVCLHHHERVDGKGYPHQLAGDALTRLARMGAVCDVYDAITSNRPYKAGWDPAESIARMASWKGHFDETVLAAFVRSVGIYPTGSLVRMESGRIGIVVEQTPGKPAAPAVSLFYSSRASMPIVPQRLDLALPGVADRIVARETRENWAGRPLDDLWLPAELRGQRR